MKPRSRMLKGLPTGSVRRAYLEDLYEETDLIVQGYRDGIARIFDKNGMIIEFPLCAPLKGEIDRKLKTFGFVRHGKWRDRAWGSEANVYRRSDYLKP